jgi:hypothetical protein
MDFNDESQNSTYTSAQFESDYADVKQAYQQLKAETNMLEAGLGLTENKEDANLDIDSVEER